MTETTAPVVRRILDAANITESVGPLECSLAGATLRWAPPTEGFVSDVHELGAIDGALGWLAAVFNTASHELSSFPAADPHATVTLAAQGDGTVRRGKLTGRWQSVVGAEYAQWFLLPAKDSRVLVPRSAVQLAPAPPRPALAAAGICEVAVGGQPVDDYLIAPGGIGPLAATGAAAAVVGSADGVWRRHVGQVRARLATTYGGEDVTDDASAQVARAASDIDAARLQVLDSLRADQVRACRQAVGRARVAVDRLLAISKYALDAADPVTRQWQDVQAGCRLAERLFDRF